MILFPKGLLKNINYSLVKSVIRTFKKAQLLIIRSGLKEGR